MSELIDIISKKDKLLDFMEMYHITGLCEATEEQLREVLSDENKDWKFRNDHIQLLSFLLELKSYRITYNRGEET